MDYRYLRSFISVAKHLSFSRASQELGIAQSAISRQIRLFEASLGTQLVVRSPHHVHLTSKGRELYLSATHFENLTSELFSGDRQPTIRIGILHGVLEEWFVNHVSQYLQKIDCNFQIKVATPRQLIQEMKDGLYDLIFTSQNIQTDTVTSIRLFPEDIALISKHPIALSEIYRERWVVFSEDDFMFQTFKKRSEKILQVNSITAILNLVKRGAGIAVVPRHLLYKVPSSEFSILPLKTKKEWSLYCSIQNQKYQPKYLKGLLEQLQNK
ncbi:MAG TPA: LysR family transcriptional regulator [Bdellovibrionota bacterium]|nr:LysR family transcriptional regulator [Bdellovibrionota bacterium]